MGEIFALLNAVFMGTGNVLARKGMEDGIDRITGLIITLVINNLMNFFLLTVYLALYGGVALNWPGLFFNVVAGFLNSFAGRWMLFWSISYIGPSRAGVLKVITPIFAIIGGVALLNEIITIPAWIGIIIVLAGVVLISIETAEKKDRLAVTEFAALSGGGAAGQKESTKRHGNIPLKGLILGLIASLFFAGGNVCRKVGVTYLPSPLLGVTIGSLVALVSAVSVQLARGKGGQIIAALKNINRSYLLSGIATALALYCLFWSLELTSISVVSSIGASEALFTILAGKALLRKNEYLNWRLIIGALIVIGGVIMLITM